MHLRVAAVIVAAFFLTACAAADDGTGTWVGTIATEGGVTTVVNESGTVCADGATEDVFNGKSTRRARRACPVELWSVARRKLTQLNRVKGLGELSMPPGNRLERLRGDRAGQHSIRINQQYRICFRWEDGYADDVEIIDYH